MRESMLLAAWVTGCAAPAPAFTPGELGRAQFQYQSGNGFDVDGDFHPALDRAMMVGTSETIGIQAPGEWLRLPALVASSADENVVDVTSQSVQCMCNGSVLGPDVSCADESVCPGEDFYRYYDFEVAAVGRGDAELVLHAKDGSVFDRTLLSVRPPSRLVVERQLPDGSSSEHVFASEVSAITLALYGESGNNGGFGAEAPVWVRAQGAAGDWLVASTGISSQVGDSSIAVRSVPSNVAMQSSYVIVPRAIGASTLSLAAGGLQLELPIEVR